MIDITNMHGMPSPAQIEAELCRRDFFYFFKKFWPVLVQDELELNWHIPYLCNQLQQIGQRVAKEYKIIVRPMGRKEGITIPEIAKYINKGKVREPSPHDTLINIPPGTSKTTIAMQAWHPWLWCVDPTIRLITGSWDKTLATDAAIKSRDIMRHKDYIEMFPYIQMRPDRDMKTDIENTSGGRRIITSVGSNITGRHAHILGFDDLLPPQKENASSLADINAAADFLSRAATRKANKKVTTTMAMMQRVHQDDPSGVWLKNPKKKIFHICLPAHVSELVSPPELKDEYVNGLLDPTRLDEEAIDILKSEMSSYQAAAQIEQNPAPEEGGMIKKPWFDIISWEEFLQIPGALQAVFDTFVDGAYSENKTGDPTGMDSMAHLNGKIYWKDSQSVWLAFPEAVREIRSFTSRNGSPQSMIAIEPKATGKSLYQTLRLDTGLNVTELENESAGKEERVKGAQYYLEARKVILIRGSWNDAVLSQLARFPNGDHDEQVDNMCAAIKRYKSGGMAFGST